jgi:5'-methylthioadenosine phosphorylase
MSSDKPVVGIITGTGLDHINLGSERIQSVSTPYGQVEVTMGIIGDVEVALIPRHGSGHRLPPHRVNYRANILTFKHLNAAYILSTAAVGSLNPTMQPGDYCVINDFIDLTKSRPFTLFDDEVKHTDFSQPYCPRIRAAIIQALSESSCTNMHPKACYVCVEGPRYETPGEIKAYAKLGGDIIGMTNATEAILAKEAGICFGTLAVVTNLGAGLTSQHLSHTDVADKMQERGDFLQRVMSRSVELLPTAGMCPCR